MKASLLYSLLFLYVLIKKTTSIQHTPEIRIKSGPIRGIVSQLNTGGSIRKYLGIPFAKAERFGKPTDPEPWTDVKDVNTRGKMCPQMTSISNAVDEDCLNLNVFVPEGVGSALPVMVWIHGGGFIAGSNNEDGSYLASLERVIVVTINYRLGLLGFLATGKDGALEGNYGMWDQIQALIWVKDNIEKFEGNPNNVTIFGESAGGVSTSILVVSPLAKGLFHNAILQSGDATPSIWAYKTYSQTLETAKLIAKQSGCPNIATLADCLKEKTMKEVLDISIKASFTERLPVFRPVIDGSILPDVPDNLFSNGMFNKVNIMLGVTDDDGSVMVSHVPGYSWGPDVSNGVTRGNFTNMVLGEKGVKVVNNQNKVISEAMLYRYTDWNNVTDRYINRRMLLDMYTDGYFIAPAIKTAKYLVENNIKTFFYQLQFRFDYLTTFPVPKWLRAYHLADVFIIFGQPFKQASVNNGSVYTKDANFSRVMIKIWTNFAKTGNPNKPADIGLVWPQYDLQQQQFMALKPNMAVQAKLRNDYVAFWNSFVPAAFKSMPKPPPPPVDSSGTVMISSLSVVLVIMPWFVLKVLLTT